MLCALKTEQHVLNQLNRWVRCRSAERCRTLYKKSWCRWAVQPFTIHWPGSWRCSFGSLDVISRTKTRRTARESHENGLWTCPLQQMRLDHIELFFCLTFSISYFHTGRNVLKYVHDSRMECCHEGSNNLHFNELSKALASLSVVCPKKFLQ